MNKNKLVSLPTCSGVYLFKNRDKKIIYIGKASSLKSRVRSYFKEEAHDLKIKLLRDDIDDISIITTSTENEASLLEAQLIKKHQPKFNVLLKDGQPFVYLLFTAESLSQFIITRNKKEKGIYFGPFLHKSHARHMHHYLMHTFRLKLCNKKIHGGCLDYHLDICAGSCTDTFDKKDYLFRLQLAKQALGNKKKIFLADLQKQINDCVEKFEFEKARMLYHYLENAEVIFSTLQTKYHEHKYAYNTARATAKNAAIVENNVHLRKELKSLLSLKTEPKSIDCFDISHFQSQALVGSCIRFTNGIPDKNKFRRFRIKSLTKQNDYAALQEIVQRRYQKDNDFPDLILIDGGKGQLHAVQNVMKHTPCISIAKREERLFGELFPDGIVLDQTKEVSMLIIALRDYAHHFAITYHRKRRNSLTQ